MEESTEWTEVMEQEVWELLQKRVILKNKTECERRFQTIQRNVTK